MIKINVITELSSFRCMKDNLENEKAYFYCLGVIKGMEDAFNVINDIKSQKKILKQILKYASAAKLKYEIEEHCLDFPREIKE